MNKIFAKRVEELQLLLAALPEACGDAIEQVTELIIASYREHHGVFLFGNGGSAADAQHIAGELSGRFLRMRKPLKAQALVGDAVTMSCIANDYGYEHVFSRQLEGNASAGDVAWGLSTSGNSPNVVAALEKAKGLGLSTVVLTGAGGGKCAELADVLIAIPSDFTPHIQEAGVLIYHCICEQVESVLSGQEL